MSVYEINYYPRICIRHEGFEAPTAFEAFELFRKWWIQHSPDHAQYLPDGSAMVIDEDGMGAKIVLNMSTPENTAELLLVLPTIIQQQGVTCYDKTTAN